MCFSFGLHVNAFYDSHVFVRLFFRSIAKDLGWAECRYAAVDRNLIRFPVGVSIRLLILRRVGRRDIQCSRGVL